MNAAEYKILCREPDVFGRFTLEQTTRFLADEVELKARLQAILQQEPLAKPVLHRDEKTTEHFRIELSKNEATHIAEILLSAEAETFGSDDETTAPAAFTADLVDVWYRYVEFKSF